MHKKRFFDDKKTEEDVKDIKGEDDVNKDDVNIQLSCTESITISRNACATDRCELINRFSRYRNDLQGYDTLYNPRKSLARNYAITFDRRVRYIRVCDNGACEPAQSYVIDLNMINQTLQNGVFQDDKVYRLEGSSSLKAKNIKQLEEIKIGKNKEGFSDASPDSPDDVSITSTIQITTVLYTTIPINAQLSVHDINKRIHNDLIKVYITTPENVRDEFTLHKCIIKKENATRNWPDSHSDSKHGCDYIPWSDSVYVPIIESLESKFWIVIRGLSVKQINSSKELNLKKAKHKEETDTAAKSKARQVAIAEKKYRDAVYNEYISTYLK
jgi:hypothetical protein